MLWTYLFLVTRCRTFRDHSLPVAAARAWSTLPSDVLLCLTYFVAVKTQLFHHLYPFLIVIYVCDCFVKCRSNSIAIVRWSTGLPKPTFAIAPYPTLPRHNLQLSNIATAILAV